MADRDEFRGDMSRNEVEMDLSKFMDLIQENADLKSKIVELTADSTINPWQKWIHLARAVDSWRIWPRAFLSVYIFSGLEVLFIQRKSLFSQTSKKYQLWPF